MTDLQRTTLTYRMERWRALTLGILETAASTFLLLIAVRQFQAGAFAKSWIAAGSSVGLLLTPLVVTWVARRGARPSTAASRILMAGSLAFLAPALLPWTPVFVVGSVLGLTAVSSVVPLLTQMYQENYPAAQRGRLFSRTVMLRILAAAGFAKLAGLLLAHDFSSYQLLLFIFAVSAAAAALVLRRCPTSPLQNAGSSHPLRALRYVREDPLFRRTLIAWMLMGFANLMMLPLRIEYLAHERYGLQLPADQIALYTAVLPNLARLVMSPVWGWWFDRLNFFTLRVLLNVGFMIGILAFFTTHSPTGLIIGALIYGVSNAGGDVAWSLWVTKFAPPERTADYMSVHTAFTGLRGLLAPATAFLLAQSISLPTLGWFAAGLIGVASLILLPELPRRRRPRPSSPLVEEVTDA